MVGREREQHELLAAYDEDEAQLIAVYGRRRVGKTNQDGTWNIRRSDKSVCLAACAG